jgi:hypothetical protein
MTELVDTPPQPTPPVEDPVPQQAEITAPDNLKRLRIYSYSS